MSLGDINSVIDTQLLYNTASSAPKMIQVRPGIIAVYCAYTSNSGRLSTFDIDSNGNIGTVLDSFTLQTLANQISSISLVSTGILAICCSHDATSAHVTTCAVDASGLIQDTQIDALAYLNEPSHDSSHIPMGYNDKYVVAGTGTGNDGWIITFSIDSSGDISAASHDSYQHTIVYSHHHSLIHIAGNICALLFTGTAEVPTIKTWEIDNDGVITKPHVDIKTLDTVPTQYNTILNVGPNKFACFYNTTTTNIGRIKTISINDSGAIGGSVIDSYQFPDTNFLSCSPAHVGENCYAIAYKGVDDDGWIKTILIDTDGEIADDITDSYEFNDSEVSRPDLLHVSDDIFVISFIAGDTYPYSYSLGIASSSVVLGHHKMIMGIGP